MAVTSLSKSIEVRSSPSALTAAVIEVVLAPRLILSKREGASTTAPETVPLAPFLVAAVKSIPNCSTVSEVSEYVTFMPAKSA